MVYEFKSQGGIIEKFRGFVKEGIFKKSEY
jgi:hypothetical protein